MQNLKSYNNKKTQQNSKKKNNNNNFNKTQKSYCDKTQIVTTKIATKLKNLKCDKTKKLKL